MLLVLLLVLLVLQPRRLFFRPTRGVTRTTTPCVCGRRGAGLLHPWRGPVAEAGSSGSLMVRRFPITSACGGLRTIVVQGLIPWLSVGPIVLATARLAAGEEAVAHARQRWRTAILAVIFRATGTTEVNYVPPAR